MRALALLALALLTSCAGEAREHNVLFVTLDTTRADFLGCYGAPGDPTPVLDGLAASGVRFEHALVSSALTPVSHASMFTGLHPYQHGLRVMMADGGTSLAPGVSTLAELCAQHGYETAGFSSAFPVSRHFGVARGLAHHDDVGAQVVRAQGDEGLGWDVTNGQRRADRTTEAALDFLREVDAPFYLWVHYWDPHDDKLLPPPNFVERHAQRPTEGLPRGSESYATEISYVDRQLGRLLRTLDERGLADDTLVVVIADHGEGLTDGKQRHGWTGHRVLYQEQMRVPLLLRVPDGPRGHVVPELARAIDLYPTVLDYLDLPAPRPVAGTSLRALIEGEPDEPRLAYAEQINRFDLNAGQLLRRRPQADLLHCVSDGEWKLIYRPSYPEESELYRLSDDPGEERNLWAEAHDHRRRLLSELARHAGWVLEPLQGAGGTLSPLAQEILEDLGYAGDAEQPSSSDSGWSWFCPGDDVRREEAGSCPSCGAPTVPRARD